MALAVKYRLDFEDNEGQKWRAEIWNEGYVGSVIDMEAGRNPVTISWSGGKLFDPIRSSRCTVSMNSQASFSLSEFYQAGEFDYACLVYKGASYDPFWYGVYVPETYEEPYVDGPYFVKLRFSDLKALKYIRYETGGALNKNHWSIKDILGDVLGKLPFTLKGTEIINILEDDVTENASTWLLNSTYIDRLFFAEKEKDTGEVRGMYCWKVLEHIMKGLGCTLFQWGGMWYVTQIENYQGATAEAVKYANSFGSIDTTYTSATSLLDIQEDITNNKTAITWLEQSGVMKFSDVYNSFIYNYKYLYPNTTVGELITDAGFSGRSNQLFLADRLAYWDPHADVDALQPGAADIELANSAGGMDWSLVMEEALLDTSGNFLNPTTYHFHALENLSGTDTYTDLWIATEDKLQLLINFTMGTQLTPGELPFGIDTQGQYYTDWGNLWDYKVWVKLAIKDGTTTYYLGRDSNGELEWDTSATWCKFRIENTLGGFYGSPSWITTGGLSQLIFRYKDKVDVELPSLNLTEAATVNFYLHTPQHYSVAFFPLNQNMREYTVTSWDVHHCSLELNPAGKTFTQTFHQTANVSALRDRELKIQVGLGDPLHNAFRGGFKVLDGSDYVKTDAWYHRGDAGNTKSASKQFIFDPYVTLLAAQRRKLAGTLYSATEIPLYKALKVPVGEGSKVYYITSMTLNAIQNTYDLEIEEVATSLPSYTVNTDDVGVGKGDHGAGLVVQQAPHTLNYASPYGHLIAPNNSHSISGKDFFISHPGNGLIVLVNGGGGTGTGTVSGNFPGGGTGGVVG